MDRLSHAASLMRKTPPSCYIWFDSASLGFLFCIKKKRCWSATSSPNCLKENLHFSSNITKPVLFSFFIPLKTIIHVKDTAPMLLSLWFKWHRSYFLLHISSSSFYLHVSRPPSTLQLAWKGTQRNTEPQTISVMFSLVSFSWSELPLLKPECQTKRGTSEDPNFAFGFSSWEHYA